MSYLWQLAIHCIVSVYIVFKTTCLLWRLFMGISVTVALEVASIYIRALPVRLVLIVWLGFFFLFLFAHDLWWFLFVLFYSYFAVNLHGSLAMYDHAWLLSAVYPDNSLTGSVSFQFSVSCSVSPPLLLHDILVQGDYFHLSPRNQRLLSGIVCFVCPFSSAQWSCK